MRIGIGYDVHRLAEGRALILGGVNVPFEKGLLGHSDADVLTHAIMDALLGGAALGDIGTMFPDTDEHYKDACSIEMLRRVGYWLGKHCIWIINIDSIIIAEKPKFSNYYLEMRANIADALGIDMSQVSVKATTEEGLGFTGRGEGMAAKAIVMLREPD